MPTNNRKRKGAVMGKISQYIEERAKWTKFGKPLRKEEQIAALFEICDKCPMFQRHNKDQGTCAECGCHIKRTGHFLNKLAWGTTRCPLPEPKWIESDSRYTKEVSLTRHELAQAEEDVKQDEENMTAKEKKEGGCGCGK
jgi:hypothetical protein